MATDLLLVGLGVLVAGYLSFPPVIELSQRYGFLDHPRGRKRHPISTPFTGGWVIFCCFWAGLVVVYMLVPEVKNELSHFLFAIFLSHLLMFVGGLIDDFIDLSAVTKFVIQVAAATILYVQGLRIDVLYVPFSGSYPLGVLAYPATVLWVMFIVNAMNNMDGLDGLAGGLSIIGAIGLLYTSIALHIPAVSALTVIMIAVLLSFMRFNFPTAKIFMGNAGSQSLGFIFAVAAIYCPIKSYTVVAMFIPMLVLGVPLVELAITFFRRLVTGRSVIKGDLGHLFYMLTRRGISKTKTVMIFWGIALGLQICVFILFLFDRRVVFSILMLFMLVIGGWFLFLLKRQERL